MVQLPYGRYPSDEPPISFFKEDSGSARNANPLLSVKWGPRENAKQACGVKKRGPRKEAKHPCGVKNWGTGTRTPIN